MRVQGPWREQYVSVAADSAVVGVVCEVDGEDHVLMVEQYRTPTGGPTHELIAGRVDEGAGCVRTAQSEALEEAGVSLCTNDLVCLGSMYASPGRVHRAHDLLLRARRRGAGAGVGAAPPPLRQPLRGRADGAVSDADRRRGRTGGRQQDTACGTPLAARRGLLSHEATVVW